MCPNSPTMGVWLLIIGLGLTCVNLCDSHSVSNDLPCNFLDSINITDGVRQTNGSILYDGVLFEDDQYAQINYTLKNGSNMFPAEQHIRGCLCTYDRPCVRFCCTPEAAKDKTYDFCHLHENVKDFEGKILDENNQTKSVKFNDHFKYIDNFPCEYLYFADEYQITHKGDVLHENRSLNHKEYCLKASLNEETNRSDLELLVCFDHYGPLFPNVPYVILWFGMVLSVVFLIVTTLIYSLIPKLRDLHGKCIICYSATLAVAYFFMALVQDVYTYIEGWFCYFSAYVIYYSLLATFLWLSVLNFDLWLCHQPSSYFHKFTEPKLFILYTIYSFGLPGVLTILMHILDSIESIPYHLRPGFGAESCFIKGERYSTLLVFHLPLAIIIIFNIVLFIMTATKISHRNSSNTSNALQEKFQMHMRLFIVMVVLTLIYTISFVMIYDHWITVVGDICDTLHGVFIFILFVLMRKNVLRLVKERWNEILGKTVPYGNIQRHNGSESLEALNSISFSAH